MLGGFPAFTRSPVVLERKCGTPFTYTNGGGTAASLVSSKIFS